MTLSTLVYTILLSIYIVILWKTPDRSPGPEDRLIAGEEKFIRMAMVLNVLWLFSLSLPYYTPSWTALDERICVYVGSALFAIGVTVRTIAIRTLDRFFTYKLTIRKEHQLIQHGIYKVLRHPSYTGTLFEVIGMMVVGRSWIGLLVFLFSAGTIISIRIWREERMLLQNFGEEYAEYMRSTYRLIPFIF